MDIRSVSGSGYTANRAAVSYAATAGTSAAQTASTALSDSGASTDSEVEVREGPGGYISPITRYDQTARIAVLYFRNTDTGETTLQVPSERVVAEYRRTASRLVRETDSGATANGNDAGTSVAGTTGVTTATSGAATATSTSGGSSGAQGFGTGGSSTSAGGTFSSVAGGGAAPTATTSATATAIGGATAPVSGGTATGTPTGGLVSVTV